MSVRTQARRDAVRDAGLAEERRNHTAMIDGPLQSLRKAAKKNKRIRLVPRGPNTGERGTGGVGPGGQGA